MYTGIVVLEPKALSYINDGENINMPDLFLRMQKKGEKIVAYHHGGQWHDIGQTVDDYFKISKTIMSNNISFGKHMTLVLNDGVND